MKETCRFVRTCAFIGLIALATLIIPHESWAGDSAVDRATLKGIEAFNFAVEDLPPDLKGSGLSVATLQKDAEIRLRSAGIRNRVATKSLGYLYVKVNAIQSQTTAGQRLGYLANVEVSFKQPAWLARDSSVLTIAPTWSVGAVVSGPSTEVIRQAVRDLTDQFANAYLSVNPK